MTKNGTLPVIGTFSKMEAVVDAAKEAARAYFAFHAKFQAFREVFGKNMTEQSESVEQANIEMVTAMFNLKNAIDALEAARADATLL
jgi:hypothetical protein